VIVYVVTGEGAKLPAKPSRIDFGGKTRRSRLGGAQHAAPLPGRVFAAYAVADFVVGRPASSTAICAMTLFRFGGFWGGLRHYILGRTPDRVADAVAFAFDAIHQTPGPYEFRGQKAQAEENHEPAGSGSHDHDYA